MFLAKHMPKFDRDDWRAESAQMFLCPGCGYKASVRRSGKCRACGQVVCRVCLGAGSGENKGVCEVCLDARTKGADSSA